ncbi:hypothetical protein Belba_0463 [Belliella baltica DSM 15883]|uniref:Lipoprotein n=1 Tax=Belliella baltica (strain DSM 15883 / CIP 108006 / LMG 21964 / BA134) TaxID=866536 RepID=I3Z1K4_BELBD|nr:hypothetical protein [Belliella baltica]AFL83122.1 hypothetical protein Belba_0463 [Belliella baltica DSM 15883]
MKLKLVLFILGFGLLFSCDRKTEYEKVKQRELESGKVYDDLFLGLKFGMPRKDFFVACWEMNKDGILTNGAHALKVQYKLEMPSGKMANMYFYPKFEEGRIFYMPVEFQYRDWFPTNPEFSSENLVDDVVGYFEQLYGNGFFRVEDSKGTFAMVKIDGNRLIRIYIKNLSGVRVDILDLRIKDIKDIAS